MFKYLIVIILFGGSLKSYSQIEFLITNISVSYIKTTINKNAIIDEDTEDGPYLYFECTVTNKTKENIIFHPSIADLTILYNYKKDIYYTKVFALSFQDNDSLFLQHEEELTFSFGTNIFIGTSIWREEKDNYCKELIEILPTLRLNYKESGLIIQTSKILNVIVIE